LPVKDVPDPNVNLIFAPNCPLTRGAASLQMELEVSSTRKEKTIYARKTSRPSFCGLSKTLPKEESNFVLLVLINKLLTYLPPFWNESIFERFNKSLKLLPMGGGQ